jgi:hypothetical protein
MERFPKKWYLGLGCAVIVTLSHNTAHAASWPVIQALRETITFVNRSSPHNQRPFRVLIKDVAGTPVYKLECHSGDSDDDSEMNFSGDFQCALFALSGSSVTSGNLLAADTPNERSTDWWNRGRLRAAQLRGKCLLYTEYSTDRHFRLRGMQVELRFTDVRWGAPNKQNNPSLDRFKLAVDVVRNTGAGSSTAELPRGPKPPESCYP